ncbi:MAG: amino acid ABC transporter permease [Actinomycetaceae bacterium]|nr:amino acid ABC transporter permease [Arcanobacterium sp.]MDD7504796.1 amino acid ABC transporter permease [Actinomycetaceae bacterium]MDY6142675.1 amino acid ABC transporter permease [Arcanobacterium sp.]
MGFFTAIGELIVRYWPFFLDGVRATLIIALFSVILGFVMGTVLTLMRMSKWKILKWPATAFVEFFRGTPLLVQLMFIFYGLPMVGVQFPDIAFIPDFSRFAAGIVAMSLNSAAYVSEIMRAGIQAVESGQMEAARSIGLTHAQAMKIVVLPQAVRNILPALGNEFVTVIKESSIVSVIGIGDLMFRTNDVIAVTYQSLPALAIALIIYFILTFVFGRLVNFMERKLKYESKES